MPAQLSIVLVTAFPPALRKVLSRYRLQGSERLEIIIAAFPGVDVDACAAEAKGFPHVRIIEATQPKLSTAEFEATQAATASYVVFAQASAWPRPGFVDAILAAQESGHWTVIGPAMANANPRTAASRAGMLIQYGQWLDADEGGPAETVPGHSSAYDRQALLALGDELEQVLDAGTALQVALNQQGGKCYLQPAACVEMLGVSIFPRFLRNLFGQSLHFANQRRRGWSPAQRALYALASPLIPFVRFWRIFGGRRRRGRTHEIWPIAPALMLGLVASAVGEFVGYTFGMSVQQSAIDTELYRLRYVQADERDYSLTGDALTASTRAAE